MASKRRLRRRQCENKDAYTKDKAFMIAVKMRRDHPGHVIDAYPCHHGGDHWHVGRRPRKVQQSISARRRAAKV